jgi:hypothetical protein
MKVHSIVCLFRYSCYVGDPKGSDNYDEESDEVEVAMLNEIFFELH